jgi:hypothetical protein
LISLLWDEKPALIAHIGKYPKPLGFIRDRDDEVPTLEMEYDRHDKSLGFFEGCARKFLEKSNTLDLLLCTHTSHSEFERSPRMTDAGYEFHTQTMFLGQAILIKLLLPVLLRSKNNPRIVVSTYQECL